MVRSYLTPNAAHAGITLATFCESKAMYKRVCTGQPGSAWLQEDPLTQKGHKMLSSLPNLQLLHSLKGLAEATWFARWLPTEHDQMLEDRGSATDVYLVSVCSKTGCLWQKWEGNQSTSHLTLKKHSLWYTKFVLSCVMTKSQGSSGWSTQLVSEWVFGGLGIYSGFDIV